MSLAFNMSSPYSGKKHIPVLLKEVIEILDPKPNDNFIDCTLGAGGHTIEILKRTGPKGKVLGIDMDENAILLAKENLEKEKIDDGRLLTACNSFRNLEKIVAEKEVKNISGIILDLGFSSMEIDNSQKGFSFQSDAPLDMRFGQEGKKASEIVNKAKEEELEKIFKEYGEERFAKRIAKEICKSRIDKSIKTTFELVEIIKGATPKKFQHGRIHFATKIFQALRISVNDELNSLIDVLPQGIKVLDKNGKIAVISFHSLEDRIVKRFFKQEAIDCICPKELPLCRCKHKAQLKILNKKPIVADEGEAKLNPRSRSAKLRGAMKL